MVHAFVEPPPEFAEFAVHINLQVSDALATKLGVTVGVITGREHFNVGSSQLPYPPVNLHSSEYKQVPAFDPQQAVFRMHELVVLQYLPLSSQRFVEHVVVTVPPTEHFHV